MLRKILLAALLLSACLVNAMASSTVTIINHTGSILEIKVNKASEQQFVPQFPKVFYVLNNHSKTSSVLTSGHECDSQPSNPAAEYNVSLVGHFDFLKTAIFGVGLSCDNNIVNKNLVAISGLYSKNISYSWKTGMNAAVTFCQTKDFNSATNSCN